MMNDAIFSEKLLSVIQSKIKFPMEFKVYFPEYYEFKLFHLKEIKKLYFSVDKSEYQVKILIKDNLISICSFNISQLYSCCGMGVLYHLWVDNHFKEIGEDLVELIEIYSKKWLLYSAIMYTFQRDRQHYIKNLLEKREWKFVHTWENKNSDNYLTLAVKTIN